MDVTSTTGIRYRSPGGPLAAERVGEVLGSWQPVEVRLAQSFAECRGLSREQVEDLYQETVIALLSRPYASEAHLRNGLRQGIRHRALNVHRDTRRRGQIIAAHAPAMHRVAEAAALGSSPESMVMRGEDRDLVLGFLEELDGFERQVFELTAEGLRYRAIARRLGVDVNEARRAARSLERKRVLYRMRHDLDWDPHPRAGARALLVAAWPLGVAALGSARRWLFGGGASAKAGALVASAALVVAGASGLAGSGQQRPGARLGGRRVHAHGGELAPPARGQRRGPARPPRSLAGRTAAQTGAQPASHGVSAASVGARTPVAQPAPSASYAAEREFGLESR